jgi:hypothetical protein
VRLDTEKNELEFEPLENAREVHYIEIEVDGEEWTEVKQRAIEKLEEIDDEKKPLVNLKIKGETSGRVNPRELKKMFRDDMFLNINSSLDSVMDSNGGSALDEVDDPWSEGKKMLAEKVNSDLEIDESELLEMLEQGKPDEASDFLKKQVENK